MRTTQPRRRVLAAVFLGAAVVAVAKTTPVDQLARAVARSIAGQSGVPEVMDPVDQKPDAPLGGPRAHADRIGLHNGEVSYQKADVVVHPATGPFVFTRRYTSDRKAERNQDIGTGEKNPQGAYLSAITVPFAGGLPFGTDARFRTIAKQIHPTWLHNLYAFAQFVSDANRWIVRDGSGGTFVFTGPDGIHTGPYLQVVPAFETEATWDGTTLTRPGIGRFRFTRALVLGASDFHFLTSIEDERYATDGTPRVRVTLEYAPPAAGCGALTAANNSLVSRAVFSDRTALVFNYGDDIAGCPNGADGGPSSTVRLRSVNLVAPDGTSSTVASYNYGAAPNGTLQLSRVDYNELISSGRPSSVSYQYGDFDSNGNYTTFRSDENGRWILTQAAGTDGVLVPLLPVPTLATPDEVINDPTASYPADRVAPAQNPLLGPAGATTQFRGFYDNGVPDGTGTGQTTTLLSWYRTITSAPHQIGTGQWLPPTPSGFPGEVTTNSGVTCGPACLSLAPGTQQSFGFGPTVVHTVLGGQENSQWQATAKTDRQGNYTVYLWDAGSPATATAFQAVGLPPREELQTVLEGATDRVGTGALRRTDYSYEYGTGGTPRTFAQLVKTRSQPSGMPGGGQIVTTYVHDVATNRTTAVLRTGKTYVFSGSSWSTSMRTIGTFYFNAYHAPAPPKPAGGGLSPDPLNRVVEVHGPCVANAALTDCAPGQIPLTQYVYYGAADTTANHANRLYSVSRSASNTGPAGATNLLTTVVESYDARGNPTSVLDENGVRTTYQYVADVLVSKATAGLTWTYGWEDGHVTSACENLTNTCEVSCYRSGTTSGCSGGALTDKLQWKAKAPNAAGASPTEKVVYGYAHGRLVSEKFYDRSGALRRVIRHDADPLGRPTYEGVGQAAVSGSFADVTLFDAEGNRIAVGASYNSAPALCGGIGHVDPICAVLGYDRLNRLTSLQEAGTGPANAACLRYDASGNPSGLDLTCNTSSQGHAQYQYDDFGNLSWVSGSWMALPPSGAALGTTPATLYEYDGAGNLIRKQTPSMQGSAKWVESTYDALGRELARDVVTSSTRNNLFTFAYDGSVSSIPSGCPSATNTKGRKQRTLDSFGLTWFTYDAFGHLTGEIRTRGATPVACAPVTLCSGVMCTMSATSSDTQLNTVYDVDSLGRVKAIRYPHGRVVRYTYGDGSNASVDRVTAIQADLLVGGTAVTKPLLTAIQWEPYGGLKAYQVETLSAPAGQQLAAVEYLLGDDASSGLNLQCNQGRPVTPGDATGRLRGLWISSGAADGTGTGGIFKRSFQWKGDQLVTQASCLLAATTQAAMTESFSYDARLRLTGAARPTAVGSKFSDTGGAFGRRAYGYDNAGNRLTATEDCWTLTSSYDATRPDLITGYSAGATSGCSPNLCIGSPAAVWSYAYDPDGRATRRTMGIPATPSFTVTLDPDTDGTHAAEGAVYRFASVNGSTPYEYYYDASGHRRLKQYPTTGRDEFFYDSGNQLLEDRGLVDSSSSPAAGDAHPIDEYLWLDGRPVALLKSSFTSTWIRRDEYATGMVPATGSCKRGPDSPECGAYFTVTDYLKKPVVLVNSRRQVVGAADYDLFGNVNRVASIGDAANARGTGSGAVLAFIHQPPSTGTQVQLRARYADVNLGASYATLTNGSMVELDEIGTLSPARVSGNRGVAPLLSPWVQVPSDGRIQVRSTTRSGVALLGYEYRRSQSGVAPVWLPLRLPGQYHDPETDLFQNWNRFYDASVGRYLEPDPLWLYPEKLVPLAQQGRTAPVYAYAGNNPVVGTDPTGLAFLFDDGQGHVFDPTKLTASTDSATLLAYSQNKTTADALVTAVNTLATGTGPGADAVRGIRDSPNYNVSVSTVRILGANGDTKQLQNGSSIRVNPADKITSSLGGAPSNIETTLAHEIGHAAYNFMHWGLPVGFRTYSEYWTESGFMSLEAENYFRAERYGSPSTLSAPRYQHDPGGPVMAPVPLRWR